MESRAPIVVGCDHAGFALKESIKQVLKDHELDIEDCGTHDEASVDYTEFGARVAQKVSSGEFKRGILICGTGLGMSMIANRFPVSGRPCAMIFSPRSCAAAIMMPIC